MDADDIATGRTVTSELWYLAKEPGSKPIPLGVRIFEGLAVSKRSMLISYAQGHNQDADVGRARNKCYARLLGREA